MKQLDDIHNQVGRFGMTVAHDNKVDLLKKIANKDFSAKQSEILITEDIPVRLFSLFIS